MLDALTKTPNKKQYVDSVTEQYEKFKLAQQKQYGKFYQKFVDTNFAKAIRKTLMQRFDMKQHGTDKWMLYSTDNSVIATYSSSSQEFRIEFRE